MLLHADVEVVKLEVPCAFDMAGYHEVPPAAILWGDYELLTVPELGRVLLLFPFFDWPAIAVSGILELGHCLIELFSQAVEALSLELVRVDNMAAVRC